MATQPHLSSYLNFINLILCEFVKFPMIVTFFGFVSRSNNHSKENPSPVKAFSDECHKKRKNVGSYPTVKEFCLSY